MLELTELNSLNLELKKEMQTKADDEVIEIYLKNQFLDGLEHQRQREIII